MDLLLLFLYIMCRTYIKGMGWWYMGIPFACKIIIFYLSYILVQYVNIKIVEVWDMGMYRAILE